MLPRKNRLTEDKDFTRIFRKGKTVHGENISIRILKNESSDTRIAFVVSNKVSKKAVVRNKLKRQLRDCAHGLLKKTASGFDVIVMTKKPILEVDYTELCRRYEKLLKKAKLV